MFLIIGERKILLFSKFAIGNKVLWRFTKVVEGSWGTTSYCRILGLSNFGHCQKLDWSETYFLHCWDSNKATQMSTWNPKLKSICFDFQELAKWSTFWVWIICNWILWWLSNLEADLLKQMKEEFEDQLGDYVELDDSIDFDF